MRIFRIERINGDGPYWKIPVICCDDNHTPMREWQTSSHRDYKHPSPFVDKYPIFNYVRKDDELKEYSYGFSTLRQLFNWFNKEEITNLALIDFNISEYEISSDNLNVLELGR